LSKKFLYIYIAYAFSAFIQCELNEVQNIHHRINDARFIDETREELC